MKLYNPETDSAYLQKWWCDLNLDQTEFENLFAKPLRNLSALGAWIQSASIKFQYEADGLGFWLCAWIEPLLTDGAQIGAWIRKDKRGTRPGAARNGWVLRLGVASHVLSHWGDAAVSGLA